MCGVNKYISVAVDNVVLVHESDRMTSTWSSN
jgi:hypothetical protein